MHSVVVETQQKCDLHRTSRREPKPPSSGFKEIEWVSIPVGPAARRRPKTLQHKKQQQQQKLQPPQVAAASPSSYGEEDRVVSNLRSTAVPNVWPGEDVPDHRRRELPNELDQQREKLQSQPRPQPQTKPQPEPEPEPKPKPHTQSKPKTRPDESGGGSQDSGFPTVVVARPLSRDEQGHSSAVGTGDRRLQSLPLPAALEGTGLGSSLSQTLPVPSPRPPAADADGDAIVAERALSDSSVVTGSSTTGGETSKPPHEPVILTSMTDADAIAGLEALLGKGKGLSVVKHAVGLAGGKGRKLLRLSAAVGGQQRLLTLSGALPPYFKTKIPVQDVERVNAKWCCVVIHARGRSPVSPLANAAESSRLRICFSTKWEEGQFGVCMNEHASCQNVSRGGLHACMQRLADSTSIRQRVS